MQVGVNIAQRGRLGLPSKLIGLDTPNDLA